MFDQIRAYFDACDPITDDDWRSLRPCLTQKRFCRRQRLITPGEHFAWDLFVQRGCLRIFWQTDDGLDRNLLFAAENSWICRSLIHSSEPFAVVGVEAIEDSDVVMIDSNAKERLCAQQPKFERLFRRLAEGSLELLQQRLILSMQNTAEGRYREFKRYFPELEGRLTQYQVAAYLGISPEFLSKIKRRFRENPETSEAQTMLPRS